MGGLLESTGLFGQQEDVAQQTGFGALPQFAQQGFQSLVERAQALSGQEAPFAPVPLAAPVAQVGFNPAQQQALQALTGRLGAPVETVAGGLGLARRGADVFGQAQNVLGQVPGQVARAGGFVDEAGRNIGLGTREITGQEFGGALGAFTDPFTQQVLDPALQDVRQQTQQLFSDIGAGATGAGAFGGTRQALLESEAARAGAREAGRLSGQLRSRGFESASERALRTLEENRSRQLQGGRLNIGQAGTTLQGAQALTGAGGALGGLGSRLLQGRQALGNIRQGIQNQQLGNIQAGLLGGDILQQPALQARAEEQQRREQQRLIQQQQQQIPVQQLGVLQSALGALPSSSVGFTPSQSFAESPLGGPLIGTGLQALGGFLSDRRFKENIKKTGREKGFNIYQYNYIGNSKRYEGVMADEVKVIDPTAIVTINDIDYVNYGRIGLSMKEVA